MTNGWFGSFPGGTTTGFQTIGVQKGSSSAGYPGVFPAGLTTGYLHIGAVQLNPNNNWVNTFGDTVTASDTMSGLQEINDIISDSVTSSDTQVVSFAGIVSFTDSVISSDAQSALAAMTTIFSDAVTGSDTQNGVLSTSVTLSDGLTGSDTMIGGIGYFNTISDSITASDNLSGSQQIADSFSDSVASSDQMNGGKAYFDVINDSIAASDLMAVNPQPNINLTGTLDFGTSYRIYHQIKTFLNFGIIIGDDNLIQINVIDIVNGSLVPLNAATINIYEPNDNISPIKTISSSNVGVGYFQFSLSHTDTASWIPGLYPWVAQVTTSDGSLQTVNCGDINLSTGIINVIERP